MVVPAAEASALEVVETELTLEVLIEALGAPPFLDQVDELDEGHPLVRGEVEVTRLVLVVAPFANQPHAIATTRLASVIGSGHDAEECKASRERLAGAFTPRVSTEGAVGRKTSRVLANRHRFPVATAKRVDDPDVRGR